MTLQIGALTESGWAAMVPLWQAFGWNPENSESVEQWYQRSDKAAGETTLLIHCRPEIIIARLLEQRRSPEEALETWQAQAVAMLRFFKANRHSATLIDAQCLSDTADAVEQLCQHLRLDLPEHPQAIHAVTPPAPEYLLIAKQLLQKATDARNLMSQLEACTLPLADCSLMQPEIDVTTVLSNLIKNRDECNALKTEVAEQKELLTVRQKHAQEIESLQSELARHQGENQLLLDQVHLLQEELEAQVVAQKAQEDEAERETSALRKSLDKLSAELSERQDREKALTKEVQTAQSAADSARQKVSVLEAAHDRLKQELDDQAMELGRKTENVAQSAEENRLLLSQVHLVEQELERQLINNRALEQRQDLLMSEQEHALAAANNQINRLQNELNRIKSSAAWKAAAPVRAMGRPFKRTPADKRKLQKQARELLASEYFDEQWYLETYPDVAESGVNPAEHYLKFGASEGRNPCERFETQWYLETNPDVQESGLNPLIHFLNHGLAEGRAPNPTEQISLPSPKEAH